MSDRLTQIPSNVPGVLNVTVPREQDIPFDQIHKRTNRILATFALVLAVFLMVAVIVLYYRVDAALDNLGNAFGGGAAVEEPAVPAEPFEFEGGGAGWIGEVNPDGTPCVGYGCTPEQDAELDGFEGGAND